VRGLGRAPGLTSVRGTVLAGSGDMMIDGVVPLGCGRVSLYRPSIGVVRMMAAGGREGVGHRGMATVHRLREGRRDLLTTSLVRR
jgi:hypothetical protein